MLVEPPEPQLEGRVRLADDIETKAEVDHRVALDQSPDGGGIDPMDAGQDLTALAGQRGSGSPEFVVAQDPAGDRLALDELDDHPGGTNSHVRTAAGTVPGGHDGRHRDRGRRGHRRPEQGDLGGHTGPPGPPGLLALEDQRPVGGEERPGLTRGPTREPA
jgi:hypothetical protein